MSPEVRNCSYFRAWSGAALPLQPTRKRKPSRVDPRNLLGIEAHHMPMWPIFFAHRMLDHVSIYGQYLVLPTIVSNNRVFFRPRKSSMNDFSNLPRLQKTSVVCQGKDSYFQTYNYIHRKKVKTSNFPEKLHIANRQNAYTFPGNWHSETINF